MKKCCSEKDSCGRQIHLYCFLKARVEGMVDHDQDKDMMDYWSVSSKVVENGVNFKLLSLEDCQDIQTKEYLDSVLFLDDVDSGHV